MATRTPMTIRKTRIEAKDTSLRFDVLDAKEQVCFSVHITEASGYEDKEANYKAEHVRLQRGSMSVPVEFDNWPIVRDAIDQAIDTWKAAR